MQQKQLAAAGFHAPPQGGPGAVRARHHAEFLEQGCVEMLGFLASSSCHCACYMLDDNGGPTVPGTSRFQDHRHNNHSVSLTSTGSVEMLFLVSGIRRCRESRAAGDPARAGT